MAPNDTSAGEASKAAELSPDLAHVTNMSNLPSASVLPDIEVDETSRVPRASTGQNNPEGNEQISNKRSRSLPSQRAGLSKYEPAPRLLQSVNHQETNDIYEIPDTPPRVRITNKRLGQKAGRAALNSGRAFEELEGKTESEDLVTLSDNVSLVLPNSPGARCSVSGRAAATSSL